MGMAGFLAGLKRVAQYGLLGPALGLCSLSCPGHVARGTGCRVFHVAMTRLHCRELQACMPGTAVTHGGLYMMVKIVNCMQPDAEGTWTGQELGLGPTAHSC